MRCLVTGAAGFIGSSITDRLLDLGHEVTGIDCFTDYYSPQIKRANLSNALASSAFRFIEADLNDLDLRPLLEGTDWVFHEAAQAGVRMSWGSYFDTYVRHNVLATQKLLEAAKGTGIRRLVYASSSSVYGDTPELPLCESCRPQPVSPYGVSKLAAEHLCHLYCANYGVPTVSLRYFTVYGPRQRPDMAFNKWIKAGLTGQDIIVYGDGEQTRDFTFIADAVDANLLAAQVDDAVGKVFNVGGGSRISVNAVLDILRGLIGDLKVRHEEDQKGDVRHTMSETTSARGILGYTPKISIADGLSHEVKWMRDLYREDQVRRAA